MHDAPRVLRVPGFKNWKYPDAPEVEVAHESPALTRHSLSDFKLSSKNVATPSVTHPVETTVYLDDAEIDKAVADIFAQGAEIIGGPNGGRNTGLTSVAGKCRNLGLGPQEIEEVLQIPRSEVLVRKHAHTSLAPTAGPVHTQSGPHDYKPAAKKPLPMIQVGYLDEM